MIKKNTLMNICTKNSVSNRDSLIFRSNTSGVMIIQPWTWEWAIDELAAGAIGWVGAKIIGDLFEKTKGDSQNILLKVMLQQFEELKKDIHSLDTLIKDMFEEETRTALSSLQNAIHDYNNATEKENRINYLTNITTASTTIYNHFINMLDPRTNESEQDRLNRVVLAGSGFIIAATIKIIVHQERYKCFKDSGELKNIEDLCTVGRPFNLIEPCNKFYDDAKAHLEQRYKYKHMSHKRNDIEPGFFKEFTSINFEDGTDVTGWFAGYYSFLPSANTPEKQLVLKRLSEHKDLIWKSQYSKVFDVIHDLANNPNSWPQIAKKAEDLKLGTEPTLSKKFKP